MAVPFIDLRRFEPDFLERWHARCREVTAGAWFVGGPEVARLEETLARDARTPAVVACANGTDALQLALRAAGVGAGDAVLMPDATFWATFEAIVNCGARPVTVDVDESDLQMDFDLFRRAVDEYRPRAAILVHLYGWGSARLDDYRAFCRQRGLPLIEDGAQVFGVSWRGASIFAGAELATVSFYPAKVLGACGDAGAVYCASAELGERVRRLGNHGRAGQYHHDLVGWNSRMSGFDAAYLNLSYEYLPARLASRRRTVGVYRERLRELGVRVAEPPAGYEENGYLNVTLIAPERRPAVEAALRESGIGFANTYPSAVSKQPGAAGFLAGQVGGEVADRLARSVVNLPVFAYLEDRETEEVLAAMKAL
ncbi:MAG TPA: DegT/DnrJ/EryC1/StrS family aminotransferase [Thermoanaerobaculia bacterium]|jgi:dTDP-4-amino-4,6-dideoxygalactose transaminase